MQVLRQTKTQRMRKSKMRPCDPFTRMYQIMLMQSKFSLKLGDPCLRIPQPPGQVPSIGKQRNEGNAFISTHEWAEHFLCPLSHSLVLHFCLAVTKAVGWLHPGVSGEPLTSAAPRTSCFLPWSFLCWSLSAPMYPCSEGI